MTRRIKSANNGNILLDGNIIFLNEYKTILKNPLGRNEDPDYEIGYSIGLVPKNPTQENIKNNVDGAVFITYKVNEEKDFNADFKTIIKAMNPDKILSTKNIVIAFVFPLIVGLIVGLILWIISNWERF